MPPLKNLLKTSPLENIQNLLYTCQVSLGTQILALHLDTGSADTWVRGKGCVSSDGSCDPSLPTFDTSEPSVNATGAEFMVRYGSGDVKGKVYVTDVGIGGMKARVPIGVSTEENGFVDGEMAGLLGLAYDSISSISQETGTSANYFDALGFTGSKNVFSFYLGNDGDGELTLGGYNKARISGKITYVPLNSKSYFQFDASAWSYGVGGKRLGSLDGDAIADTGTALLLFNDKKVADSINRAIGAGSYDPDQGVYPISCTIAKTGPSLTLSYRSTPFTIPASIYVFNSNGTCFSGISYFPQQGGPSIFGDIFLRAYYSVYDKNLNRVGFAKAVHDV